MRGLNVMETDLVCGSGVGGYEQPMEWEGVSQWEWDQFIQFLEEQNKRNGNQQH